MQYLSFRFLIPCALMALSICADGAGKRAASPPPSSDPIPLGRLDPFWRYSAALGPFLEGGQALIKIPDTVLRGDFPYRKRPFDMEVPFADHLSVVRLLGGYSSGGERDLAFRGPDGKIQYRMDLLRARLKPYLDQGYTSFTLVLDNIPWCFPEQGRNGTFGQCVAPRDPAEWGAFVKALCGELVKIMGRDAANRLRFRMGTEANGRERFDGSLEQFLRHYDAAAGAIREMVRVRVPAGMLELRGRSVRRVRLSRQSAPHDRLRADLAAAGLLKAEFVQRPDRTGLVHEMGEGREALKFVNARMAEYTRAWEESLTLKPLEAEEGAVRSEGQGTMIEARLAPPEILVLVIR